MEKEVVKNHHSQSHTSNNISTTTADFGLQWGNRKRLRRMKIQAKNEATMTVARTTVRIDRRVIRTDGSNNNDVAVGSNGNHSNNGHFNLRQRLGSPAQLPARALRNTESASPMKGHNNNHSNNHQNNGGGKRGVASPDRVEIKGATHHSHENGGGGRATSSETKNGSSSGGGSDVVWPPKFMIALTNKEKEEDFMAIKGSKLPHRPKKRAKFIQRTLNLVSPGGWLCDLTLERYEVREKKISKKRPRGLKAMSNYMDSDSE